MTHPKPLISFKKISKSFGDTKVITNLDMDIDQGDILGLIGKSGCGKSTLIKIFTGFYDVDSGTIEFKGEDVTKNKKIIRMVIGYGTQENSFYHELTVLENLRFYGRMYDMGSRQLDHRIKEVLKLVELTGNENKMANNLSGGMKRRLDFAIAMLHDPEILILDEPTTGLDPILRENMFKLIKKTNQLGKTIILISHHLNYLQEYCTKIGLIEDGKIGLLIDPKHIPKKYSANNDLIEAFISIMEKK